MRLKYAFMAVFLLVFYVNAYGVQVSVPELYADPGSVITVAISVDDATAIAGGDIVLEYAPTILAAKEARATDLVTGLSLIANTGVAGKIILSMAGPAGLAGGSGAIVEIDFEVKTDASGESPLTLSDVTLFDELTNGIAVTIVDGSVTVRGAEEPAQPRRLVVVDAKGKANEVIATTIQIDDLTGVAGGDITLVYDPTILSVDEVKSTDLLTGMSVIMSTDVTGRIIISMAGATGADAGTGAIFDISFKAKDNVSGEAELTFESVELFDEEANDIPVEAVGGKITVEEAVSPPPVVREHSPGSPMLALQATYSQANVHGHTYIDIWKGNMSIEAGMFLEFQVAMFSGNPSFNGTVDLHTSDGSALRDSGAKDQNDISAHPSTDLSEYARDQWYHRRISLDALAGKTLDGVMIATDSDEHSDGIFRAYVDSIQITDGEHILMAIYMDEEIIPITGIDIATGTTFAGTEGMSDCSVSIVSATPITPRGKLIGPWGGIKDRRYN